MSYNYLGKVIVIGNTGVGKSCMSSLLRGDIFNHIHAPTIGVDFICSTITTQNNETIKLQIWDTAGQERFHAITKTYYCGIHAAILMYDITNRESFNSIHYWLNEIKAHGTGSPIIFLVGNKIDLDKKRVISTEEGQHLANYAKAYFHEIKSLTIEDINPLFESIGNLLVKHPEIKKNRFVEKERTCLGRTASGVDKTRCGCVIG